ncbi:hypothetical protein CC86DRAFT_454047 [Ophiobolus disseminans]|uniref:Uncharacterized protein n=1 Tax=Ophiobolus disseminans TaxID=1469910 RepID=A0A6A7A8C2_9PLEO|nr:hypothetical protein CC86DRAFT_454047 [Ophiobolus disseminans]
MTFLRGVSDRFWDYVSPRKTQHRREKDFKIPAIPVRHAQKKQQLGIPPKKQIAKPSNQHVAKPLDGRVATPESSDMSPDSRVNNWSVRTPSLTSDDDMDHTLLPPSPPASAKQTDDYDLEGDTLVESPTAQASTTTKTGSSAKEVDANGDTMVVDDGNFTGLKIDVDEERKRRDQQGRELRAAGWSEDAVFLFQKLGMRGFEPLLAIDWLEDLETLPADLFTARNDKVFLRPVHPSHSAPYRAQQALSELFDLGGRVRDAHKVKAVQRKPHFHIKRAVQKYATWAMRDGAVDHLWLRLPLFKTITWNVDVHSSMGEREMINQLSALHNQWHEALQIRDAEDRGDVIIPEVPTLYGVTASHTVMAFVSFAPPTEEQKKPQLRLIAMFDFGLEGYDVWHSLAIAIIITHCRNRMMQLKECLPVPELLSEEDPDL